MSFVKEMWHVLSLPCRDAAQLMSQSMDGPLCWHLRLAVRLHRLYCRACRRYGRQLVAMRSALRQLAESTGAEAAPQVALPHQARERIQQALRDA